MFVSRILDSQCYELIKNNKESDDPYINSRIKTLKKYMESLDNLLKIPVIEQKTEEWYNTRQNLITASDFAQSLGDGKFGSVKDFYKKKCNYDIDAIDKVSTGIQNPFFKWGNQFESVALDIYKHMYGVPLHEFGLIKHPKHDFLGASPDGITDHGIMVEIKCPMKRQIDGTVPLQYYYQIQGQLDVCDLQECDYFESEFDTFYTDDDFFENFNSYEYKGIIIEENDGTLHYSVVGCTIEELKAFNDIYKDFTGIKKTLWFLRKFSVVKVHKDEEFFQSKVPLLKEVWENIEMYRKDYSKYVLEVLKEMSIKTQVYKKKEIATVPEEYLFLD